MKSLLLMIEPDIPAGALIIRRSWRRSTPEWLIWAPCATRAPGSPQAQSRRSGVPARDLPDLRSVVDEGGRRSIRIRCWCWRPDVRAGSVAAAVRSAHRAGRGSHGAHRPAALICAEKSPVPPGGAISSSLAGPAPRRRCGRPWSRSWSCGTDLAPVQATADGWVSARHDSVAVSRGGQGGRR